MTFEVTWTPTGERSARELDRPIAEAVDAAEDELSRRGCDAADYRLTGDFVDRICVVRLSYDYRLLVCFPAAEEVVVLLVGRHVKSPRLDVYMRLYAALGLEPPTGERTKPPCCDGEEPPVDEELVDKFIEGMKALRREDRGRRGRTRRGSGRRRRRGKEK